MSCADHLLFATTIFLLISGLNWGVTFIRYASSSMSYSLACPSPNATQQELYKESPVPDLLQVFGASAEVQMIVYCAVFVATIVHIGAFIWNSVELRTVMIE